MKFSLSLMLCVCIILQYKPINSGLVKGLFEKTHDTAQKVRQDIRNIFHLNNGKVETTTIAEGEKGKVSNVTPKSAAETTTKPIEVITQSINNKTQENPDKHDDKVEKQEKDKKMEETTTVATTTATSTTAKISETTPPAELTTFAPGNDITTEQTGRENLKGGCATNYQRTVDGRCKPIFR